MTTSVISIDLPAIGGLETSGEGTSPSDAQKAEEAQARQDFLALVSPYFESLPKASTRIGGVSRVELLGRDDWSQQNHYLLLVTINMVDMEDLRIPEPVLRIPQALSALLPKGSQVSVVGRDLASVQEWTGPWAKPGAVPAAGASGQGTSGA